MAGGDVWGTRIDKLAIHFVGEEEKVVLLHEVAYLIHLATGIQITGRIIGITNQDSAGAVVYQLLELLHFRQREPLFYGRRNRTDFSAGGNGKRHIVGISRLRHDNLVTRIKTGHK